ncbi:hypothetical protein HGA09_03485 [Cellulomonas hominis]|nr:hypothetical protein [Cellulomonas hominis]
MPVRRSLDVTGLARCSGLAEDEVLAALGLLELTGRAERSEGGWRRSRPRPTQGARARRARG